LSAASTFLLFDDNSLAGSRGASRSLSSVSLFLPLALFRCDPMSRTLALLLCDKMGVCF
jgi:hypothetical protein